MNVTVIGAGLMGSSMGLALRRKGHWVFGSDLQQANAQQALSIGAFDAVATLSDAVSRSKLVVVAIPVDAAIALLPQLLSDIPADCTVMDLGSTKAAICSAVDTHSNRRAFVAAHPMAGKESGGALGADALLFHGKPFAICNQEQSAKEALQLVCTTIAEIGARPFFCTAQQHDSSVALVSHLPQLLAYAYASLHGFRQDGWQNLAASGFGSATRLACSPSDVWIPIFEQNNHNIKELVAEMQSVLQLIADALAVNDANALKSLINSAHATRRAFDRRVMGEHQNV
ncbi:Prephenate dehydrogenase [anaerobic digester metagenome]